MPLLHGSILAEGAIVEVQLGLSLQEIRRLRKLGRPVPQPVLLKGMLDTGADVTCADPQSLANLPLPASGAIITHSPALGGQAATLLHDSGIRLVHPSGDPRQDYVVEDLLLAEMPLGVLGYEMLVGRDVLDHCRFVYDGKAGQFELDY